WNRVIAVNQTGTFLGMRAAIPALRRAGGGSIVNISSVLAPMGSGNSASYTASKGAVTALTRTVSVELATQGIRVNAVHPGGVETPMAVECLGDDVEARRALIATHPMGRIGEPGEIASGVLFLASDEASFVTGATLVIDGGNTVWQPVVREGLRGTVALISGAARGRGEAEARLFAHEGASVVLGDLRPEGAEVAGAIAAE